MTAREIDTALERGRRLAVTEPRAASARYDADHGATIVELKNGCTFSVPAQMADGLERASDAHLAAVTILGEGYGLHRDALDADFSVPGLLAGIFGTRSCMARRAGPVTSVAKAAAARENGRKGGRPKKAVAR